MSEREKREQEKERRKAYRQIDSQREPVLWSVDELVKNVSYSSQ